MALPVHEQETNIIFMRNSDMAVIYTSDSTTMTKLDKIIGKTYTCPKDCISFRKGNKKPSAPVGFQLSQMHK